MSSVIKQVMWSVPSFRKRSAAFALLLDQKLGVRIKNMSIRSALQEINAGYFSDSDEEEEVEDGEQSLMWSQSPMRNQSPLWSHRDHSIGETSTTELWMEVTEQTTMPKPPITESKLSLMCFDVAHGSGSILLFSQHQQPNGEPEEVGTVAGQSVDHRWQQPFDLQTKVHVIISMGSGPRHLRLSFHNYASNSQEQSFAQTMSVANSFHGSAGSSKGFGRSAQQTGNKFATSFCDFSSSVRRADNSSLIGSGLAGLNSCVPSLSSFGQSKLDYLSLEAAKKKFHNLRR
uniref:Uncharacterized protein n=1 Tax=Ditylenchus dipsaci TaxID=166011 RepID=A0A915E9I9_9BILA